MISTFPRKRLTALLGAAILGIMTGVADEKIPAFPGAEGFGRYTTGGRGGNVYHVTSLRDGNTRGTLRWALSQPGPRTVVFDVSGTIHLSSELRMPENTTIAGQTAPGDGICIADYPVSIASNSIVRYVRFRLGNKNVTKNGADGWDGLSCMDSHDVIVDHCSVSWSIDECCSLLGNTNTTLQWSIVSQSLVNSGHSKGAHGYGGNWGGSGASFHHNLVIHHSSRTPRLGPRPSTQKDERMDMRNNVIYNYGGNGCYGGEGMNVNIVNNYYKPGPGTSSKVGRRIAAVGIRTKSYCQANPDYLPMLDVWGTYYVTGNVNPNYADVTRDNWNYGMYNQIDQSASATDGTWNEQVKKNIRRDNPVDFIYVTTHSAEDAYARVLDYAGASLSRDSHDDMMVNDARQGKASHTGSGLSKGFINSQDDNKPAGAPADWSAWPVLNSTEAPLDTDGDGMPDAWETANGLDPNNNKDRNLTNDEGYTMLEVYLASLVDDITAAQNAGGTTMGDIVEYEPARDFYEISNATREGKSGWSFGYGISIANTAGGSYTTSGDYLGMGRDQEHTITLPAGVTVKWIEVVGHARYNTSGYSNASLVKLGDNEYPEGKYSLPKGSEDGRFEIDLGDGVKNSLAMTWKGNNPYARIYLHTTEYSDVADIRVDNDADSADDGWYTLQGLRLEAPTTPGIYIHKGLKVIIR